ncbi:MAG: hypothetical protein IIB95_14375 [Candidatus Marinimicrobia bacterium]|nr:hypothetical protein [Candidatus Neomarinimicrobiota bacterium]
MAKLKSNELLKIEKLFGFKSGYVLDFTNATFEQFFRTSFNIEIYSDKYEVYGDSKGKRLRAILEIENNLIVGNVINELIEYWRTSKMLADSEITSSEELLSKHCQDIADRLKGKIAGKQLMTETYDNEKDFLKQNFGDIIFEGLNLEGGLIHVLNQRVDEIKKCLKIRASLSVIFLCGSTLEGFLLGIATKQPSLFNTSTACPKDSATGKIKHFQQWSLNDFINVAHQIGYLGLDVKKHSHSLREFRNYIHPFSQWSSGFNPDHHTALISWQVLKAAISDLKKNVK